MKVFFEQPIVDLEENAQLYLFQEFLSNVNALTYVCTLLYQV